MAATSNERSKSPDNADSTLIFSLEPLKTGDQFDSWPLHVTLQRWFHLPETYRRAFINQMTNRAIELRPIEIVGGEEAYFGENKDVHVRKLIAEYAFRELHDETAEMIGEFGGTASTQWVGDEFKPHVTFQGDKGVSLGDTLQLRDMHLIRRDEKFHKTVEATFRLSKGLRDAPTTRF